MASTISVRKLDSAGEPICGNGQGAFIYDLEAVAQKISTTLKLFVGEWFENLALGTDLQGITAPGNARNGIAAALIQERILSVPYVLEVTNISTTFNPANRILTFFANVRTAFGTTDVSQQFSAAALNQ